MKKAFLVLAVFAAMLFIVCCGDDSSDGVEQQPGTLEGQKCYEDGVYSCDQDDKLVLQCENGKWVKHRECSEGQTCNSNTGNCDTPNDNNGDDENVNDNDNEQPATQCGNRKVDEGEVCDGGAVECKTLDATLLGFAHCKADCSGYEMTECTSGGNNGGGGNGGSTSGDCPEILNCWLQANQSQDQAGMQACVNAGSQEGQSTFMSWYNCVYENQCQQVNCQQCANEYNACAGGNGGGNGGGGNGGSNGCAAIYQCYNQCQDSNCATACVNNGSQEGQQAFMAMYNCWDSNGCFNATSQQEFDNCVNGNCGNETNTCMSN